MTHKGFEPFRKKQRTFGQCMQILRIKNNSGNKNAKFRIMYYVPKSLRAAIEIQCRLEGLL